MARVFVRQLFICFTLLLAAAACKPKAPLVPVAEGESEDLSIAPSGDESNPEGEVDSSEVESSTDDAGQDDSQQSAKPAAFLPVVTSSKAASTFGNPLVKGDDVVVKVQVENFGTVAGTFTLTPRLTSLRFKDFTDVAIDAQTIKLAGSAKTEVSFLFPLRLADKVRKKNYALGRGDYSASLTLEYGTIKKDLPDSAKFAIGKSNVVLVFIMVDDRYFKVGDQRSGVDPVEWVKESQTRKASLYYPGNNTTKSFAGGFDEMLGIKELYQAFSGVTFNETDDVFKTAESAAAKVLGLPQDWISICPGTCDDNHGFDHMIALNPNFFGGRALSNGQVSSGFASDPSKGRSQMIISHGTGHVFGSPLCDPLQGYMMCSGEKAASYMKDGDFLWHEDSFKAMNPKKFE